MESRSSRWKNQGLIFIALIISLALCTAPGEKYFKEVLVEASMKDNWIPLVSLVIVFFGSDAIGYLINSIGLTFICFWRLKPPGRWYTSEWERNLKTPFWSILREACPKQGFGSYDVKNRMTLYPCDVILSYFWQQAPEALVKWVSRRHDVYWMGMCTIWAFLLAIACFLIFYFLYYDLSCSQFVPGRIGFVGAIIALSIIFLYMHGYFARKEAWQIIELWAFHKFHREFKRTDWNNLKIVELLDLANKEQKGQPTGGQSIEKGIKKDEDP